MENKLSSFSLTFFEKKMCFSKKQWNIQELKYLATYLKVALDFFSEIIKECRKSTAHKVYINTTNDTLSLFEKELSGYPICLNYSKQASLINICESFLVAYIFFLLFYATKRNLIKNIRNQSISTKWQFRNKTRRNGRSIKSYLKNS